MTYLSTFNPTADPDDIAAALVRDGGAIIKDLATPELMDEIRQEIDRAVPLADQEGNSALWPEGNRTVGALCAVSPLFVESLLVHEKILAIVDRVLKPKRPMLESSDAEPKPRLAIEKLEDGGTQLVWSDDDRHNCHHYTAGACSMLEVGAGREAPQYLHRENAIYQPYLGNAGVPEFIVSTMWAGTNFTAQNGATRLVPGSHNWPEERIAKVSEIQQAEMTKGSVLLWVSRTLHGAAKSSSETNRTGYFASYIADWVRQEENQYVTVDHETALSYSDNARKIIGYRCSDTLGWVKGRDKDNLLIAGDSGQL